jgi:hypothetical protein
MGEIKKCMRNFEGKAVGNRWTVVREGDGTVILNAF